MMKKEKSSLTKTSINSDLKRVEEKWLLFTVLWFETVL